MPFTTRNPRKVYEPSSCRAKASVKRVRERFLKKQLRARLEAIEQTVETSKLDLAKFEHIEPAINRQESEDEQDPFAMMDRILGKPQDKPNE